MEYKNNILSAYTHILICMLKIHILSAYTFSLNGTSKKWDGVKFNGNNNLFNQFLHSASQNLMCGIYERLVYIILFLV